MRRSLFQHTLPRCLTPSLFSTHSPDASLLPSSAHTPPMPHSFPLSIPLSIPSPSLSPSPAQASSTPLPSTPSLAGGRLCPGARGSQRRAQPQRCVCVCVCLCVYVCVWSSFLSPGEKSCHASPTYIT